MILQLKVADCCGSSLWALLFAHVEDFVPQDGQGGTFSQQLIAEGEASVLDLSSSFLLKSALKAETSELTLIPEAAAHF